MKLTVIKGKAPKTLNKNNRLSKAKLILEELRTLESVSASMILSSKKVGWDGLTERLIKVHNETLTALKFVKLMARTEFGDENERILSLIVDNN